MYPLAMVCLIDDPLPPLMNSTHFNVHLSLLVPSLDCRSGPSKKCTQMNNKQESSYFGPTGHNR